MRRTVPLVLMLVLAAAGCGGGDSGDGVATAGGRTPAAAATSAAAGEGDGLKFAQCMRENGLPWFEDPEPGARGVRISIPQGADKAKVDAAMAACRQHLPNGGEPPEMDAASIEQARQLSKCMRANGVPNFPDPQPDGGMVIDGRKLGTGPGEPAFDAAEKKCAQFQPGPRDGDGPATDRTEGS